MKKLSAISVIVAVLGMSSFAFATQTFEGANTTCAEIQAALKADGSVSINSFFGPTTYYASPDACETNSYQNDPARIENNATIAYERSSDQLLCYVGYACESGPSH
jgi:hypothetical protein